MARGSDEARFMNNLDNYRLKWNKIGGLTVQKARQSICEHS